MTTREQNAVIDHMADAHDTVRVTPIAGTTAVLAQGWTGGDDTGHATTPAFYLAADCPDATEDALSLSLDQGREHVARERYGDGFVTAAICGYLEREGFDPVAVASGANGFEDAAAT